MEGLTLPGPTTQAKSVTLANYLAESAEVLQATRAEVSQELMDTAVAAIVEALAQGRPMLVCGNGGSAADAMHITAELVGRFLRDRRGYKVHCLTSNPSVLTAWSNDVGFQSVFARQVEAYGEPGAILLGISTSGTSKNVVAAFQQARAMGMKTVALVGQNRDALGPLTDYLFTVPSRLTPMIQQAHLCLYHYLCWKVEERLLEVAP